MAPPNERNDLGTAWRALADASSAMSGWRSIPIFSKLSCRVLAARHLPGNEEALLIGFRSLRIIPNDLLPEGRGFQVRILEPGPEVDGCKWIALLRQPAGSLEMFIIMSSDVITTLEAVGETDDNQMVGIFLARIKAWQRFMERSQGGVLSSEAEIGLHGELIVLTSLLKLGVAPSRAVEAWQGPREGLHDFKIGIGALEVKSTISQTGFPATISSIEQMDNSMVNPLYLAGVRLRLDQSGKSLVERIDQVDELLREDRSAKASFEILLIHAGYSPLMGANYSKRFAHVNTVIFQVDDAFPKLIRSNVPTEILKVQYQIDLGIVTYPFLAINEILHSLGEI